MRNSLLLLALPLVLPSCMPEVEEPQAGTGQVTEERLAAQTERLTRVESELHEIRLLFNSQSKRIEEIAAQGAASSQNYALQQNHTPPQQVVIMPPNPVVTHRWDQQGQPQQYPSSPPATASRGPHTIQSGDTLSEIARDYGVSVSSLLTANPGTDPLRLRLGKQLAIPSGSYASAGSNRGSGQVSSYQVRSGDTLSEIARDNGISLSALMAQNPGLDPARLRVGKELRIPGATRGLQQQAPSYQPPAAPDYNPSYEEPTRYASPPLNSLQTGIQTTQPIKTSALPAKKVLVRFPREKSWGEVADDLEIDLETLQTLNNCTVTPLTRIPAGNTIFIPSE